MPVIAAFPAMFVPTPQGPFDFVFSDADKDWHEKHFDAVAPRLVVVGGYTWHSFFDSVAGVSIGRKKREQ